MTTFNEGLFSHISGYTITVRAGSACTAQWITRNEASSMIPSADFNLEDLVETLEREE